MDGRKGMVGWLTGAAIVLTGLIVVAGIITSSHSGAPTTTTTTVTASVATTPQLYELTFEQQPGCEALPWAVSLWNTQIGNLTLTSPPNTTIKQGQSFAIKTGSGLNSITFTVPTGSYDYKVSGSAGSTYGEATVLSSNWTVWVVVPNCAVAY